MHLASSRISLIFTNKWVAFTNSTIKNDVLKLNYQLCYNHVPKRFENVGYKPIIIQKLGEVLVTRYKHLFYNHSHTILFSLFGTMIFNN